MKKILILSALILSACGGGGGGGSSTPTAPSASTSAFALDTAATNIFSSSQTFNIAARTQNGRNLSINIGLTPQPNTTFEGQNVSVLQSVITLRENNTVTDTGTSRTFFSVSPLVIRGSATTGDPDGQNYEVSTATNPLPASANVNSNGPLANTQYFSDVTKTTQTGTNLITYSLEADTSNTAFLCFNNTIRNFFNTILGTQSECYRISPDGTVLGLKIALGIYDNGVLQETIQFQ